MGENRSETGAQRETPPIVDQNQLKLLSRSSQIEEASPSMIARLAVIVLSCGVFAGLALASIANINEIARSEGVVEPTGLERDIQHATGGFIATLHARDGELVKEGQPIVTLADTDLQKDLARARRRSQTLDARIRVLRSYLDDSIEPLATLAPEDRAAAIRTNEARRRAFLDQIATTEKQRIQKTKETQALAQQIDLVTKRLAIAQEIAGQRKDLWQKGYVTKIDYLNARQNVTSLSAELDILRTRVQSAEAVEAEYRARIDGLRSAETSKAIQSLNTFVAQLKENEQLVAKLEAQREALVVRATTRGVLNGMKYASIGGLVPPATTITKIVPTDEDLVVRARVKPKDISRIEVGSPVQLRFQSFDFERYGALEGEVTGVSAASFLDESGRLYYSVLITPSRPYLGDESARNQIKVGMSASAEIITGRRTILQYLLQPIRSALSTAITES